MERENVKRTFFLSGGAQKEKNEKLMSIGSQTTGI